MKTVIKSDLTVVGAGYAGIVAAITAARLGLKVALVNDRDVIGGNASSEHRIHVDGSGWGNNTFYSREAGIADELKLYTLFKNPRYNIKKDNHLSDMALLQKVRNEENISLFTGTSVYDGESENGKVVRAYGFCAKNFKHYQFESEYFVDASGDGILASCVGAEYTKGREAKSEFNESLAPEVADTHTMGSAVLFSTATADAPVKFVKPDFAYNFVDDGIIKYFDRPETGRTLMCDDGHFGSVWWIEFGGMDDTIADADDIDLELRKIIYGYWDYVKNSGKYPQADNMYIEWIAPRASKRESLRFYGDHMLNQNDIEQMRDFEDKVSTGGWSLDIHDVGGIYGEGKTSEFGKVYSIYSIPYSIMYSRNIENLFLAGRIASCSHVAMGSTRVMETLGAMAQAVGTAAALCKKYDCSPRDVRAHHITELQDILQRDGQFILGREEDCGKAKDAKITASSTKTLENTKLEKFLPLDKRAIYTVPVCERFESIDIYVKNVGEKTTLEFEVVDEYSPTTYLNGEKLFGGSLQIDKGFEGYVTLSAPVETQSKKIFVMLTENENIELGASNDRITGAPSFKGWFYEDKFDWSKVHSALVFKNITPSCDFYCASNVVNGISRPLGHPNAWVSDGKQNEYLEFEFSTPTDISEIQIYFNPQYESEQFDEYIGQLVRDYDLKVTTADGNTQTFSVTDNAITRNAFAVDMSDVTKVRFEFIQNFGADNFEVFTVKMF